MAGAGVPVAGASAGVPEGGLAYHGVAVMSGGTMEVGITPVNHGPSAVADATVRLSWSVPLADRQELPDSCARTGARVVLCRTGALAADGVGERTDLRVRLRGAPSEALLELSTAWGGAVVDRDRVDDRQRVLVLDTGDAYFF
ncbi:hypothetical protein [Streptomyces sp. DH24]|uniref:hypothetical protein n=1 Tax=Streptomyces sp. DH24 TaxID=3040123 RepID=UPI0024413FD6|nr:hypothetical protein [Streptomyces sp. DH24]MDG9718882.1 hypothetical protein [Streptomyces sp. DH24]